jgi:hypothetical protein
MISNMPPHSTQGRLIPQLKWIETLYDTLQGATGDVVEISVSSPVDPLMKLVTFRFHRPLQGESYNLISRLLFAYAKANNCYIKRFRTTAAHTYEAEVLIKRRIAPESRTNPILDEKKG